MNLKSKGQQSWDQMQFAYLIVPQWGDFKSDEELYAAVRKEGRAVIRPFEGGSYKLLSPIALTPEEFEAKWKVD